MNFPNTASAQEPAATNNHWLRRVFSRTILSDRAILFSTIVVAAGFLLSKVLGFGREILIARAFGTNAELDAFRAANTFSDLLDSVIAGTTIAAVFIPVFSTYLVQDAEGRREGWRFASAVLNAMALSIAGLAALGILFSSQLIQFVIAPGFGPAQRELAATLMRIVLFSAMIFGISGTVTGILHAQSRFVLPALAPPIHNIAIIAALFLLVPRFGIFGLAYGVVIGSLLHLCIQIPGLIRSGMQYSATLGFRQRSMRHLVDLLGPRVITTNVIQLTRLIMINLASFLGEGSISALGYAYSLWQFPETMIGTAIALVVFPRLARQAAQQNLREFNRLYRLALLTILALAIPSTLFLIVFAQPLVTVLFQRGAFGSESTELVARVLQFYALGIIGESILEVTARVFYAQHDSRTPMSIAIVSMIVRIILMVWWRDTLGAAGLALAYAIGVVLEGGALWWLAGRRFGVKPRTETGDVRLETGD